MNIPSDLCYSGVCKGCANTIAELKKGESLPEAESSNTRTSVSMENSKSSQHGTNFDSSAGPSTERVGNKVLVRMNTITFLFIVFYEIVICFSTPN